MKRLHEVTNKEKLLIVTILGKIQVLLLMVTNSYERGILTATDSNKRSIFMCLVTNSN